MGGVYMRTILFALSALILGALPATAATKSAAGTKAYGQASTTGESYDQCVARHTSAPLMRLAKTARRICMGIQERRGKK